LSDALSLPKDRLEPFGRLGINATQSRSEARLDALASRGRHHVAATQTSLAGALSVDSTGPATRSDACVNIIYPQQEA